MLAAVLWGGPGDPPRNVVIHRDDGSSYAPCEPSIAISPLDPQVMVAGSILDNVYHSHDGGATWERQRLRSPFGVFGDPCVVASPLGDFYYLHLSNPDGRGWDSEALLDRIVCQRSRDNGASWNRGGHMGRNGARDQDKEWAAVSPDGRSIYACWTQFDKYGSKFAGDSSLIFCSASNRRAVRWSEPVRVSDRPGDCRDGDETVEGAVPSVLPDGSLAVVWAYREDLWFDRSEDGGRTWLPADVRVADIIGGWEVSIPGLDRANGMPVTAVDHSDGPHRGRLYVNWTDTRNGPGDMDVFLAYSDDRGATWSAPVRVNDDPAGAHQFFTWLAVDAVTGHLHAVFYDRRNATPSSPLLTEVTWATSRDGGATWTNQIISESPFYPGKADFFGDYNNIAAHGGHVRPIWTREDNGVLSIVTALIEE
ncbi:MAG: hypothetical protein RJA19_288 [Bacteroidota bacterium]